MRLLATALLLQLAAAPATAQELGRALDSPSLAEALGCEPFATVRDPRTRRLWVACEDTLFELSPAGGHIVQSVELESFVDALDVAGGQVQVELSEHLWIPVGEALSRRTQAPEDLGRAARTEGQDVVRVRLGRGVSVRAGSAIAFERPGPAGRRRVGSGRVLPSRDGVTRVRVGLGERVPEGSFAVRVDQPQRDLFMPPRIGDRFLVTAGLEGLLWERVGAALRIDAAYHFEDPMVLRVAVAPVGVAHHPSAPIFTALTYATFGLDLPFLELSAGAGVTLLNEPRFTYLAGRAAGVVAVGGRAGATDGVSVELMGLLFIQAEGIAAGGLRGRLQIPLTERLRLVHRMEAGEHGYLRGEIGALFFVDGRGDRGSLGVGAYLGVARYLRTQLCGATGGCAREALGPTVAIELDWRP